jgi:lipopolysaccharide biosynthesis glycosyltransferase
MTHEDIQILFSCNEKYAAYLSVTLVSILKNTSRRICFYIVGDEISEESKRKLNVIAEVSGANIEFIAFPSGLVDHLPVGAWPKSIYVKLLAPRLFPTLDKIIWIDVDTLVLGDIARLWDTSLDSYALAATAEDTLSPVHPARHRKRLKLDGLYFNAGVLLLNLDYWRQSHISEEIVKFIEREKNLIFPEQDAINVVLHKQILPLDCRFNFFPLSELSSKAIQQFGEPVIVHFIVQQKPWRYRKIPFLLWSVRGYKFIDLWWQYAHLSPWKLESKWSPYVNYYRRLLVRSILRKLENMARQYIRIPMAKLFGRVR